MFDYDVRIMIALLQSNQILTSGLLTTVIWDSIIYNRGVITDFINIFVPDNFNIVRGMVRLTYDINNVGIRTCRLYKNNTDIIPNISEHYNAATTGHTSIILPIPILEVNNGDSFKVIGIQNSGGNLNILKNFSPSFSLEFGKY